MTGTAADTTASAEFAALMALSQRFGSDPLLVQGPGGNVSLKQEGVLWIKASGTWLMDALRRDIMVPMRLQALREAFVRRDPACETCLDFVRQDLNRNALRPSIETTMHALLPQRVVVHVHCVETIAWACRADAPHALPPLLHGLDWAFIRYGRPGVPLTRAMEPAVAGGASVLVLGNHGLVVATDTVAAAADLVASVSTRLRRSARPAPPADLERLGALSAGSAFRPAEDHRLHGIATDAESLAIATRGSLYPDHVIFLGRGAVALRPSERPDEAAARSGRRKLPMLLVPGAGVLLREDVTPATLALARCLADVTCRVSAAEALQYLEVTDEDALLDWDAEKYRQDLAGRP